MENIINNITEYLKLELVKINNEYNSLTNIIDDKNNKINLLTEEIDVLKKKNNDLTYENKSKSSSSLWESTQLQLKEKDLIIENLKKDIEFYKRNGKTNNIMNIYQPNENNIKNSTIQETEDVKLKEQEQIQMNISTDVNMDTNQIFINE